MSADHTDSIRTALLQGSIRLDLCGGLTSVPEEIREMADFLEILDLSHNQLTELPDWLPELTKLKVLFCSHNPFEQVPEVVGRCPALELAGFRACRIGSVPGAALPVQLRGLILTGNRLTSLPPELGCLPHLQKLMLSGNRLSSLPRELAGLESLELLRLAANEFISFPDWLWELPSLAWLGVGGNPCTASSPATAPPATELIPWDQLEIGGKLGEGASGVIHEAVWQGPGGAGPSQVAVKLFKGSMTSDGLPSSEMAASLASGGHPHLIGALGRITGHPQSVEGLVMRLMDPAWQPLARPPSLASCTRDLYAPDMQFTVPQAQRLIASLAGAARHLHEQGLLHGDFYAHNVLYQADGHAFLGDFGAASPYPPGPEAGIQRIEVRAFGILVSEILSRCPEAAQLPADWKSLPVQCTRPPVSARPLFNGIGGLSSWKL